MAEQSPSRAGQPAEPRDLVDVAAPRHGVLHRRPRPRRRRPAGRVRHLRAPRLQPEDGVQRDHILATTQAICEYRTRAGVRRAAVPRPRHPRAVRAGLGDRAGGARRQRRDRAGRRPRRLHPDARGLARDPARQRGGRTGRAWPTASSSRRRTTRPPTAASSTTRRTAARPTPTPRGDRGPGQRADRAAGCARCGGSRSPGRGRPRRRTTSWGRTSTTCRTCSTSTRSATAGVRIGADPLGGASVDYWGEIAERHGLDLTVVNPLVDPTWRFMTLDWDGKIRMDCSSPNAMASLIRQKDGYDIATGNDADADRHGIVTPDGGLMNPNHFLAVAIGYLFGGARPGWPDTARIGKTLVSSSMIDRVAADARQAAGRGAGRLQVVRARAARRVVRLRRRGVRGRVVPAPRRHACGPPTRTASCWPCWPPRSWP